MEAKGERNALGRLEAFLNEGFRIVSTHMSIEPPIEKYVAEVKLKKGQEQQKLSSSDKDFFSHVTHLYGIPHIEDDGSDFVYIEDNAKFWRMQEEIVNLFTGKLKEFVVHSHIDSSIQWKEEIKKHEKNWILSEERTVMPGTKLSQIFFDLAIFTIVNGKKDFKIIPKENLNLTTIGAILSSCQKADLAVCFSAFLLGPNISKPKKESDIIIGLLVYDMKKTRTLSFNLNTLSQFHRINSTIAPKSLWEYVYNLFSRTDSSEEFLSYLPLPLNLRDYTPLPWFCSAFIKGIKEEISIRINGSEIKLDLPMFLAFGTPMVTAGKLSYDFDAEKQRALIMLAFNENGGRFLHQVRFDMSKGERSLHIDYQIFPPEGFCYKAVGHSVINYKEIWEFSENLAIGFLIAAAYDINFEKRVVPSGLYGIKDAFRENPLTVYPLFVRSMAARPYRAIIDDIKLLDTFRRITNNDKIEDLTSLKKLQELGLVKDGRKTVLGDIVYARLIQTSGNKSNAN